MRSEWETPSACEETDVKVICALEEADGEYKDCPVACRANESTDEPTDTVVKSGDLAVSATAASERKAIVGAVSDLDTLKFRTSEEVTISKVTLERYGYAAAAAISGVRLEDENGNVIASAKGLNSKDQVTLSIDKKYRNVDGTFNATVVVELHDSYVDSKGNTVVPSGTLGFKVIDADSTAKNLNLDDYSPYTYDIVVYDAVTVSLDAKWTSKNYNYEEGEMYEVAKLKVKASASPLLVKGFTLTNNPATWSGKLDMEEFLDKVEVSVDGENVKGLKFDVDDDELTISFNEVEIAAKWNATFAVSISLADFDEYGTWAHFGIAKSADFNATEKKTWARIQVTLPTDTQWTTWDSAWASHRFVGSKIKLANTKLSNAEAPQWADDVVVAEWTITVSESVKLDKYVVTATNWYGKIEEMRLVIAGEEYDATPIKANADATFTFSNVEIEKSGKVQILVDIDDDAATGQTVTFTPAFNAKNAFVGARYVDAREDVDQSEVAGSVSFVSKLTIQAAKASMENNLTKDVEFIRQQTSRKVVFDGTYTAKKGDIDLNKFEVTGTAPKTNNDVTFYLFVNGTEVADADVNEKEVSFSDVRVANGKSVTIKLEAEIDAYGVAENLTDYNLKVWGDDKDGNEAGNASDSIVTMKIRDAGSVKVDAASSKNTVLLKAKNQEIAKFQVKPSNESDTDLTLDDMTITVSITPETVSCAQAEVPASCSDTNFELNDEGTACVVKSSYNGGYQAWTTDPVAAASCSDTNFELNDEGTACVVKSSYNGGYQAGTPAGQCTKTEWTKTYLTGGDIRVKIGGTEIDDYEATGTNQIYYTPNEEIGSSLEVKVELKKDVNGVVSVSIDNINGKGQTRKFEKKYADALVYITSQEDLDGSTRFVFAVETADSDSEVSDLYLYVGSSKTPYKVGDVADGDDYELITPSNSAEFITQISYKVTTDGVESSVVIDKDTYNDYFKVGSTYAKVFKVE